MSRLAGRVALVTGAASGIGAACAVRFAEEGAVVVGLDVAGDVDHHVDVRDEAAVSAAVRAVVEAHGRIDVLVNAAGVAGVGPVHLLDEEEWDRVIDINLKGTYLVSKHVLAPMMAQRSGSIINLASMEGLQAMDVTPAYNASKGGVVNLTRNMAIDYGRSGIRVNCICPGFIDTPMIAGLVGPGMEAVTERITEGHMLGRLGRAEEVAAVAAFLASDDASFVSGHPLVVDGGYTAGQRAGLAPLFGL